MINQKEAISILTVSILLGIIISLVSTLENFLIITLTIFVVIMINLIAKKITSYYLDTDIEIKIWEMKQFWYKTHLHFQKPIQAGVFIPLILKFLTFPFLGGLNWMGCLTFDASGKVYRAARRHGIYSFSEVSEEEMGWIAGAGIIASLIFGIIGYLINQETFAKLSITYAFYNMIPAFDLDGAKIFFGNITFWAFLAIITCIGALTTIIIV